LVPEKGRGRRIGRGLELARERGRERRREREKGEEEEEEEGEGEELCKIQEISSHQSRLFLLPRLLMQGPLAVRPSGP
jgi:hypothetical protein